MQRNLFSVYSTLFILVSACSGGSEDGGAPSGPSSTPASTNAAPTIQFEISTGQLLEQAIFTIDTITTNDRDRDSFTISVTQTSGPSATRLEDVNSFMTRWRAPDLAQDLVDQMGFEIRAEDSRGAVSTATALVPVRGFSGPGQPVAVFDPSFELKVGNVGVPGTANTGLSEIIATRIQPPGFPGNPEQVMIFGENAAAGGYDYSRDDLVHVEGVFSDISFLEYGALSFNGVGRFTDELIVLDEASNRASWLFSERSTQEGAFQQGDGFSIEKPCFFSRARDTGQDFVWIGQRGTGFSVVRIDPIDPDGNGVALEFDSQIIDSLDNGRSLCHLFPTSLPSTIYSPDPFDDSNFDPLIAVDYDANELVLYGDTDEDQAYEELGVIPIDTQSATPLSIVDVFSRGGPNRVPRWMAILMTDGVHDGEHRLIIVSQDNDDREISQTVFSWEEGIPIALVEGAFVGVRPGDQFRRDIVVVNSTSGQSLYFENKVPDNLGVATVPIFAQPVAFDTGVGAGSAVTAFDDAGRNNAVMASFPDSGVVRLFHPGE
ncbi:MAG: hypothetical protein AAFX54_04580 [Pseudomonadota bacterium]